MKKKEIIEILAEHVDQLNRSHGPPQPARARHERVQALLDLAEQLHGILVPVAPDPDFRRRLHGELILEAQSREEVPEPSLFEQHRKGILIGAAIGSVASVVGVIVAFLWRQRQGRATHVATG